MHLKISFPISKKESVQKRWWEENGLKGLIKKDRKFKCIRNVLKIYKIRTNSWKYQNCLTKRSSINNRYCRTVQVCVALFVILNLRIFYQVPREHSIQLRTISACYRAQRAYIFRKTKNINNYHSHESLNSKKRTFMR